MPSTITKKGGIIPIHKKANGAVIALSENVFGIGNATDDNVVDSNYSQSGLTMIGPNGGGYFFDSAANGIISFGAGNWGFKSAGNVMMQFLSSKTRFASGREVGFFNTAESASFSFDFANMPAAVSLGNSKLKASNLGKFTRILQLPEDTRGATIAVRGGTVDEVLTVDNTPRTSGALTRNTTYQVTAVAVGATNSFASQGINGTAEGQTIVTADMENLDLIFKTDGTTPTPDYTGGLELTPVMPPWGSGLEITSDTEVAADRERNFPVNITIQEGTMQPILLSGGSGKALVEGHILDGALNKLAVFEYLGGAWQLMVPADRVSNIVAETTTARTLILSDGDNKYIRATNASATIITVPTNASVPFPIGTETSGVGTQNTVSFSSAGVTVNDIPGLTNFSAWALKKVATDEWDLLGSA